MKVLVVIVTYNATKWINQCFGSLAKSSMPVDVAVFDNDSVDDTVSIIRNRFPEVIVYENGDNLGFGRANNLGLKLALKNDYDYVLLLNQDAWIEEDTIKTLINDHLQNLNYGVIVPLQMNGKGNLIDSLFLEFTIANNRELITNIVRGSENFHQVEFANAACWLMPISTVEDIGGFDPLFPHYGEDNDYLNRLNYRKLNVGLNISTCIYHDRENRVAKKTYSAVVNESYIRELVVLKNPFFEIKSKAQILADILVSSLKFITSLFNRYYIYKIVAYFRILKKYELIKAHREIECDSLKNYI